MTEAANDNTYFDSVRDHFANEWDARVAAMDGSNKFQAEDMMEAHATPLAYVMASAIVSGYSRENMLASVTQMLNEAIDVDLHLMGETISPKELN